MAEPDPCFACGRRLRHRLRCHTCWDVFCCEACLRGHAACCDPSPSTLWHDLTLTLVAAILAAAALATILLFGRLPHER